MGVLTSGRKSPSTIMLAYHPSVGDPYAFAIPVSAIAHTSELTRHPPYKKTHT